MAQKSSMDMMEMFNLISINGLTPNQFYLLYSMRESVATLNINVHQELRTLVSSEWVCDTGVSRSLTKKSIQLVNDVEKYFLAHKKKTNTQVLGADFSEKIKQYLLTFPKMKLPSGKAARTDEKNVETAFRWFFDNYPYNWEVVLKATAAYVDEYQRKNYMYMQTSQYFIRKQNSDKTWGSELANWCALVESGIHLESGEHFSEKVV